MTLWDSCYYHLSPFRVGKQLAQGHTLTLEDGEACRLWATPRCWPLDVKPLSSVSSSQSVPQKPAYLSPYQSSGFFPFLNALERSPGPALGPLHVLSPLPRTLFFLFT